VSQTTPAPVETGRRKIKELEAMVADVVRETPDTTTLVLFTGNERLDYEAGHFLTIDPHQFEGLHRFTSFLEDLKGKKEPVRAYSMSSAPHERYIAFTIKEERYVSGETKYPPLLSPLRVHRMPAGTRLRITGFTGPYTLTSRVLSRSDHLVHICAGSGSVPNFSILKHALVVHEPLRHTFIYSNRTWDDVIFREQLGELARQHPDRLRLVHTLTREPNVAALGPGVRSGRVNLELIRELVPDFSTARSLVCGPAVSVRDRSAARERGVEPTPRFLESALKSLETLSVPKDRITRESYG